MKKLFVLILFLQTTLMAFAYDIRVDGLCYDFTSDSTVAVTYINLNKNNDYLGNMAIPAAINYEGKKYAVTSIGSKAFYFCEYLKSVSLPSSIVTIEDHAFNKCTILESVEIPEGVKEVGAAFSSCSYLKSIVIPSSVSQINPFFILNCLRLEVVVCKAPTPPTFGEGNIHKYVTSKCTLKVPKQSLEEYKKAEGWKEFGKIESL